MLGDRRRVRFFFLCFLSLDLSGDCLLRFEPRRADSGLELGSLGLDGFSMLSAEALADDERGEEVGAGAGGGGGGGPLRDSRNPASSDMPLPIP